jgi:D-amino-acid oxidase
MYECAHLWRESVPDPWWIEAVPDFRRYTEKELPLGYTDSYVFTQPVIEMPVYLDYLMERFYSVGGKVEVRAVASLREAGHGGALVVNCTGLASYDLVKDERLYPIRGQVIRVSNPGIERSLLDSKHPGGSAYVVPRSRDCILGGTSERGNWDTTPDMETAAAIFRRCADVEPKILKAAVLEHKVGLRPGRDQIRLELEELEDGSACIHNYGHGGAGITLSWGCADEVVRLARRDIDAFQDFQDPDSV